MRRSWRGLAIGGLVASALTVVAGARAGVATATVPTSWFGLVPPTAYRPGDPWGFGALLIVGIAALVLMWLLALRADVRGRLMQRQVWGLAALWSAPLAAGPPLISKDVYAYAAHGLLLRHGADVYSNGVDALARLHTSDAARALAAVDPTWRHTSSPYGPLASAIERVAAEIGGGNPVGTVVVLRVAAVLSVLASARLAAALSRPHPTRGLVIVALNPLVLIQLVSASHFEAEMCALLLGGLVAAKRDRWLLAVLLVCAAGAVKAPALAALPALLAAHCLRDGRVRPSLRIAAGDVMAAAAFLGVLTLLVPHGLGWIGNLSTPSHSLATIAPSSLLGHALAALFPSGDGAHVVAATQAAALLAAAAIVIFLGVTVRRRPLEVSVGYGLLAVAVLAPVVYPWYLLWGAVCLLPTACGLRRDALVAMCSVAALAAITGAPTAVTSTLDIVAVSVATILLIRRARCRAVDAAPTASAGRMSA